MIHDLFDNILKLLLQVGPLPWMLLLIGALVWLLNRGLSERSLRFGCMAFCLAVQIGFFLLPKTDIVREQGSANLPDILFARDYLRQHGSLGGMPTIYSAYGRVEYVWLELGTNSFFDWWQTGGFMFRRQTAMEGQRRALVVGPFEISRFREIKTYLDQRYKNNAEQFFQVGIEDPEPTVDDLARLCREPGLDYAILKQNFSGLYAATNGRVYVYDCRQVRDRLHLCVASN